MMLGSEGADRRGNLAEAVSPGKVIVATLLMSAVLMLPCAPSAAAAPYEPDNTILEAAGPLFANQTYSGAIETPGDRDFFYFYVTSPTEAQVTLTVSNLGGGGGSADINAAILDASATPLSAIAYLRAGESHTLSLSLPPQKYFIEVVPASGFGRGYSLATGGGSGAFGPYAAIEGRCSRARHRLAKALAALHQAQAKLQRTTARLRRSRYASAATRREARLAHHKTRVVVRTARSSVKTARRSREPWCSIAA
jgi:hypothetical protein